MSTAHPPGPVPDDVPHLDDTPVRARGLGGAGLFGEVLLVVLGVSVLSLPVVTVLPALAAGAAHVRRRLSGDPGRVVDVWHDFVAALRGVWPYALGSVALLVLLWFNLGVTGSGALPGGTGVQVMTWLLIASLVVVLLRAAGGWRRGAAWRDVLRDAGRRTGDDLAGSALVLLAVGLCGAGVRLLAPLAVLVPGLLALAVVAVEHRTSAARRTHP